MRKCSIVNTVNFNIHYFYGEPMTILSGVLSIIIMVFPRILILVQNIILIYLLEILNTILQDWRHCYRASVYVAMDMWKSCLSIEPCFCCVWFVYTDATIPAHCA